MSKLLLCIGPERFRRAITRHWQQTEQRVLFASEEHPRFPHVLPIVESQRRRCGQDLSALMLLVPRRSSPQAILNGPTVAGLPTGLLPADEPAELTHWLSSHARQSNPRVGIMAMWRRSFLSLGVKFHRWLDLGGYPGVEDWFANEVTCAEVCRRISSGPNIVLYLGHGRSQGLCAYLGLRWNDVVAEREFQPCGTMICFACETLKRDSRVPFGYRMVFSGRSLSYFGSCGAVPLRANAQLANLTGRAFATEPIQNLAQLVRRLHADTQVSSRFVAARQALQSFRIIGNPLQQFSAKPSSPATN